MPAPPPQPKNCLDGIVRCLKELVSQRNHLRIWARLSSSAISPVPTTPQQCDPIRDLASLEQLRHGPDAEFRTGPVLPHTNVIGEDALSRVFRL